jgi:hypothetical protein
MTMATLGASLVLAACGGDEPDQYGSEDLSNDSLVPIADAPTLPDTTRPVPPETVFVAPAPPPVASRPVPRPAAPRPAPASPQPAPPAAAPSRLVAATGTQLGAVTVDSVHSRYNQVGDIVRVRVSSDLNDASGRVVIPAGAVVALRIDQIAGGGNRGDAGTLVMSARDVSFDGNNFPLTASATDFEFLMKARGIGTGEVAKTAGGAAAGAIIGRVIGGKKGTLIGAIGGAAAGAAVADRSQDRDIIVSAGKPITLTLRDDFSRPAR